MTVLKRLFKKLDGLIDLDDSYVAFAIDEAKIEEKQQVIDAYNSGIDEGSYSPEEPQVEEITAEDYYETINTN